MSNSEKPEEAAKLEDLDFKFDSDFHEAVTNPPNATRMGEDVRSGGIDSQLQQQDAMASGGYQWANELPDLDQEAHDPPYDYSFADMFQEQIAGYAGFVPLQPEELHENEEEAFEQLVYRSNSPRMPAIASPATHLRALRPSQQYQHEQYTMRRSVEATVSTSTYTYATPTQSGQPEDLQPEQKDVRTTQEGPEEGPEASNKRLSGRSGIPRAPRHRDAFAVSDSPPRVPADHIFHPQRPRKLKQGRADSGRNLMALFGSDEEPRTKYPMTIERGRKGQYYSSKHRSWDEPLPARLTLKEICNEYPNHVWGSGLRIFMRENWDAERIYRELPVGCRADGAEQRKWNYLQQAMGREDDRMAQEDGNPREPQKKTPEKRKGSPGADDSDYGDDEGDGQPQSSGGKRRRTGKGSVKKDGPKTPGKTTYTSSDFFRIPPEHSLDSRNDHNNYFFSQAPSRLQTDTSFLFPQTQPQLQPQMSSSAPFSATYPHPVQSHHALPPQAHIIAQSVHQPSPYVSMSPRNILDLSVTQLDEAYRQLRAQIINQIFQNRRMTDAVFRAQPFDWQFAQAQRRFSEFQHGELNALILRHNVDISHMRQATPIDIFEAVLRSRQSSMGNAAAAANRDAALNLEARRQYVGQLVLWARGFGR